MYIWSPKRPITDFYQLCPRAKDRPNAKSPFHSMTRVEIHCLGQHETKRFSKRRVILVGSAWRQEPSPIFAVALPVGSKPAEGVKRRKGGTGNLLALEAPQIRQSFARCELCPGIESVRATLAASASANPSQATAVSAFVHRR